jgi:hypothetical protein
MHWLVACQRYATSGNLETERHHADIMARFEDALDVHPSPKLNMPGLCAILGVPERT